MVRAADLERRSVGLEHKKSAWPSLDINIAHCSYVAFQRLPSSDRVESVGVVDLAVLAEPGTTSVAFRRLCAWWLVIFEFVWAFSQM